MEVPLRRCVKGLEAICAPVERLPSSIVVFPRNRVGRICDLTFYVGLLDAVFGCRQLSLYSLAVLNPGWPRHAD